MKAISMRKWFLPCIVFILSNWSTKTTVLIDGIKKQRLNFSGQLYIKGEAKPIKVDNISVDGKYQQIPVYEKPKSTQTNLENNPKKGIITKIDLSEIQEIRVPQPSKTWHYQRSDGARKSDYVEIEVVQKKEITYYLIDFDRKLICDQIKQSSLTEMEVPFNLLDRIIIHGYEKREPNKTKKEESAMEEKKKKCECPKKTV